MLPQHPCWLRVLLISALITTANLVKSTARAKRITHVRVKGRVCRSQGVWALKDHSYTNYTRTILRRKLCVGCHFIVAWFFYITFDFTLPLSSVLEALVKKMKGGNITRNIIWNQRLYISLWFCRAKYKRYQLRQLYERAVRTIF